MSWSQRGRPCKGSCRCSPGSPTRSRLIAIGSSGLQAPFRTMATLQLSRLALAPPAAGHAMAIGAWMLPRLTRGELVAPWRWPTRPPPLQAFWAAPAMLNTFPASRHAPFHAASRASALQHRAAPRRLHVAAAAAADAGTWGEGSAGEPAAGGSSAAGARAPPAGFTSLERIIASNMGGGPGGDWKEVEVRATVVAALCLF